MVLRKLFGEPDSLREWVSIRKAFSSRLLVIECHRTIDRLRLIRNVTMEVIVERLEGLEKILSHVGILPMTEEILSRAEQPFSTPLGTLDGIHLATALAWRRQGNDFTFATHDRELALAARADGFPIMGM